MPLREERKKKVMTDSQTGIFIYSWPQEGVSNSPALRVVGPREEAAVPGEKNPHADAGERANSTLIVAVVQTQIHAKCTLRKPDKLS